MNFLNKVTAASLEEMLQQALQGEYQQWDLYYSYSNSLTGPSKDAIKAEFILHAKDEALHIDILQRHLVGMGVVPTRERKKIENVNGTDSIVKLQMKHEQEAVNLYTELLKILDESKAALRIDVENILSKEQEHYHDLELLLK